MTELNEQHIHRAKLRMKKQANQGQTERQFQVGDMVSLILEPYVQSSLALRANQKLAIKYFNPYRILKHVGQVSYQLDLPPSSSIHPVFHVSQLKHMVRDSSSVIPYFPMDLDLHRVPE